MKAIFAISMAAMSLGSEDQKRIYYYSYDRGYDPKANKEKKTTNRDKVKAARKQKHKGKRK